MDQELLVEDEIIGVPLPRHGLKALARIRAQARVPLAQVLSGDEVLEHGQQAIEDVLIGFFYGGVGAALYEMFYFRQPNYSSRPGYVPGAVFALILTFTAMYAGAFVFPEITIYSLLLVMFLVGTSIILYRPNLVKHALVTGALMVALTFVFFQIFITMFPGIVQAWWELDRISGILISGIPLEELFFAFLWGYILGPASEVVARMQWKDVFKF